MSDYRHPGNGWSNGGWNRFVRSMPDLNLKVEINIPMIVLLIALSYGESLQAAAIVSLAATFITVGLFGLLWNFLDR